MFNQAGGQLARLAYIDALRGIAILMVIAHHSQPYFAGITSYSVHGLLDILLQNGDKGVTLFFVMSAFTLCHSMDRKKATERTPLRNYFLRRAFRIVPLYYFTIFAMLVAGINHPSAGSVAANIFFIHGLNPAWINSTVPGGWSVGIEVLFYLAFPLVFLKINSRSGIINFTLLAILFAKLATALMSRHQSIADNVTWGVFTYENICSQLPVFLIGIVLYRLTNDQHVKAPPAISSKTYLLIAAMVIIHLLGGNLFKAHYLFAMAFAFFAFGVSLHSPKLFVNRFLIGTGKLSYSIYLIHLIVANLLVKYNFNHYNNNPNLEILIRFTLIFTISILISLLTYNYIEKPFMRLGKRLITRMDQKAISTEL